MVSKLKTLGISTIADLLYYFPFRYEDYSEIFCIENLQENKQCTIKVRIDLIQNRRSRNRRMNITEAMVSDETGSLRVVWFNQPYMAKTLEVGDWIYLSGEVKGDYSFQMINPIYEKIKTESDFNTTRNTGRLLSVYPLTRGVSSKQLRSFIHTALKNVTKFKDFLPPETVHKYKLPDLAASLKEIHFPKTKISLKKAENRFKFEELFLLQLHGNRIRHKLAQLETPLIEFKENSTKGFVKSLPYTLTAEQKKSAWEILQDMQREQKPMNRLLEGDVGSGKTVVAALAMLNVLENDFDSVLLAPTEILAEQHYKGLRKLLADIPNINIVLFTRTNKYIVNTSEDESIKLTKKKMLEYLNNDEKKIIIGTHSLIQDDVNFRKAALIIVDEQHRFGVKQRESIKERTGLDDGLYPHFLAMTATPIPRSLALTVYGDLDISIIDELPPGRKVIESQLIDSNNKMVAYDLIKQEVQAGRQIFAVAPLIDESDKLGVKSVTALHAELTDVFPQYNIEILHGKIKAKEKAAIMERMLNNEIHILVSTSVIEVGIDIQNATVMMIEGAERFGLAQLHQFRGRVGRGDAQSYCLIIPTEKISERLELFVKSNNGFELAEYDLKLRGPGDVFGTAQSGLLSLKIAKLTDTAIIKVAREAAENIINSDPNLIRYPRLLEKLNKFLDLDALQ